MNDLHKRMIIEVCEKFKCNFNEIFSRRRQQHVVYAKKVIYWVLRKEGLSYNQISKIVDKDHETIIVGIRSLPEYLKSYASEVFMKYRKIFHIENKKNEQELTRQKVFKILALLNKNHSIKEISDYMGEDIEPLVYSYLELRKIPNYQTGGYVDKYFFKKVQKIKKNY